MLIFIYLNLIHLIFYYNKYYSEYAPFVYIFITFIYSLETITLIISFTPQMYFKSSFNKFNFISNIAFLIEIFIEFSLKDLLITVSLGRFVIRLIRIIRILPLFRIIKSFKNFSDVF